MSYGAVLSCLPYSNSLHVNYTLSFVLCSLYQVCFFNTEFSSAYALVILPFIIFSLWFTDIFYVISV